MKPETVMFKVLQCQERANGLGFLLLVWFDFLLCYVKIVHPDLQINCNLRLLHHLYSLFGILFFFQMFDLIRFMGCFSSPLLGIRHLFASDINAECSTLR